MPKANSNLGNVLKYGQAASHLVTVVTQGIKFIKLLAKDLEQSKELKFGKEQFQIMNSKLDVMDSDFREVKSQIKWTTPIVNLGSYDSTIEALQEALLLYVNAPSKTKYIYKVHTHVTSHRHE